MPLLQNPNFAPKVRARLSEVIEKNKNNQEDLKGKPYIVSDWDNTAIIFDSQQNLFLYQMETLNYKLTPERFAEIIAMDLSAKQKEEVYELLYDIEKCYRQIYLDYKGMAGEYELDEIKRTAEYQIFYLAMACLYKYPLGYVKECCRIIYLFENFSLQEVQKITEASIFWAQSCKPEKRLYEYERNEKQWQVYYYLGMRFVPEQQELFKKCMENGINVYVCSASHQTVVEVYARHYGIPAENVFALETELNEKGQIVSKMKADKVLTIKEGKAETVRQNLVVKYEKDPILVMGDSMGDFAMLTEFDGIKYLIHTKYLPNILLEMETLQIDPEKILIQGRNEAEAKFVASEDLQPL